MKFMLPNLTVRLERWRFNKDYGVWVSTHGRFRNRNRANLPIKINQKGYCCVKVDCTTCATMLAHRLVMLTWRPTDEAENLTVDHKNHNKRDNSIWNLEWVTYEENIKRAQIDFIKDILETRDQQNVGVPYGQKYNAFKIIPKVAPAINKVHEVITVKNGDQVINQVLARLKQSMGESFETKKMRNKIKAIAIDPNKEQLSCYGFEIRGIKV